MNIVLIGNPNCGKTTLFNSLTNSKEKTANYAGVTTDIKIGHYKDHTIVDLPGIYSIVTYSPEEKVTYDYLKIQSYDLIILVIDTLNISRSIKLLGELSEFKANVLIALNMVSKAKKKNFFIDLEDVKKQIGIDIVEIEAIDKTKIKSLTDYIDKKNYKIIQKNSNLNIDNYIHYKCNNNLTYKLDKIFLNKYLGYPIFLFIMFLIFHLTFSDDFLYLHALNIIEDGSFNNIIIGDSKIGSIGVILQRLIKYGLDSITVFLSSLKNVIPNWCYVVFIEAIWAGIKAIISFLPNILLIYFFISILEDSGYMIRISILLDRMLKKIGLSGKASICLLSAFACGATAISTTAILKSQKEKQIAVMLSPFLSCSAKLPIWTSFGVYLFNGNYAEVVVFGVYLFGIVAAIITAFILNKIIKGEVEPFVMEVFDYKIVSFKNVFADISKAMKSFLLRAFTIIALQTIIFWYLLNFDFQFNRVVNVDSSILGSLCKEISFIFNPLGFSKGKYGSIFVLASFAGIISKEEVVVMFNSLSIIDSAIKSISIPAIFSFLIFNLLTIPCVNSLTMAKEALNSNKKLLLCISFWFFTAYFYAWLVYIIMGLII